MSENKKLYWVKLPTNYFNDLHQKKMRKQPQGRTFQVIYMELLLMSCNNAGIVPFLGVYDTIAEEIAEEINESIEDIENALAYFSKNNLITYPDELNGGVFIPQVCDMTGSETPEAERQRRHREKVKALQCHTNVTQVSQDITNCHTEGEGDKREIREEKEGKGEGDKTQPDTMSRVTRYGYYNRVPLTDKEYCGLVDRYGKTLTMDYINKADRTGKNRGRDIDNASLFIANMIEQDFTRQQIDEKIASEKSKYKLQALEDYYLNGGGGDG